MPVQAIAKGVRQSPRKVAVVASLVRGRSVEDALVILEHTPRRSATAIKKVIESARANADYNHGYKPNTLKLVEISVTPGPRLKRIKPAWRGSANPYQKKSAHIRVVVDGEKRQPKPIAAAKKAPSKAKAVADTKEDK